MLLLQVCCCGPSSQEISIAKWLAGRWSAAAATLHEMQAVPCYQPMNEAEWRLVTNTVNIIDHP